jgi:hypothetical protein
MNLEEYLEALQNRESVFPIDSLHSKKEPLRTPYPSFYKKKKEEEEEDIKDESDRKE